MAVTLADKVTLARLALTPVIIASYLLLPIQHHWCFWVAGWLCGLAEFTDFIDGRIARARKEVSDFGKLADPFCDVFYRIGVFLALLLPAGGIGYVVGLAPAHIAAGYGLNHDVIPFAQVTQLMVANADGVLGAGLMPWLPVTLMVLRELVAGGLRAMSAATGLVLAARTSGKVKAWLQGFTIITVMAFPAVLGERAAWHLTYAAIAAWICAAVSVASICEYIWVNRRVLVQMAVRSA